MSNMHTYFFSHLNKNKLRYKTSKQIERVMMTCGMHKKEERKKKQIIERIENNDIYRLFLTNRIQTSSSVSTHIATSEDFATLQA
jgi:hypothetical protein